LGIFNRAAQLFFPIVAAKDISHVAVTLLDLTGQLSNRHFRMSEQQTRCFLSPVVTANIAIGNDDRRFAIKQWNKLAIE
jgi:hypothetical protein